MKQGLKTTPHRHHRTTHGMVSGGAPQMAFPGYLASFSRGVLLRRQYVPLPTGRKRGGYLKKG